LDVAVNATCVAPLRRGQPLAIRVDGLSGRLTGSLDEIAPQTDPQTRTRLLKINLPDGQGLQHGQLGWLELACQASEQALLVPAAAVLHYGQLEAVKVVVNGNVQVRHVRTGKRYGDQVHVLSGLHEGDTVVVGGVQP
jgi:multidrug efflux pump subunit AcrA (membrane-fusion protein)